MRSLILSLILSTSAAHSEPIDRTHLAAHVGTAFALQTIFYGAHKKYGNPEDAEVFAFVETQVIGALYKMLEHASPGDTNRAVAENIIGSGLAIGVHWTFDF